MCVGAQTQTHWHTHIYSSARHASSTRVFLHLLLNIQCGLTVRVSQPFLTHLPVFKSTTSHHSSCHKQRRSSKGLYVNVTKSPAILCVRVTSSNQEQGSDPRLERLQCSIITTFRVMAFIPVISIVTY